MSCALEGALTSYASRSSNSFPCSRSGEIDFGEGQLPDGKFAEGVFEQSDDGRRPLPVGVKDAAVIDQRVHREALSREE